MSNGPSGELPARADELRAPTVLRMILGTQLRRLREAAGVTPDRAGFEIRASRSKISRMENGRVGFKARHGPDLLTLYGIIDGDALAGWFESCLRLEIASPTFPTFDLPFVHRLF